MTQDTRTLRSIEHSELHIGVALPTGCTELGVLLAAARAGESPIIDLDASTDAARFERNFQRLQPLAGRRLCLRVVPQRAAQLAQFLEQRGAHFDHLLLAHSVHAGSPQAADYGEALALLEPFAALLLCEISSAAEAQQALTAGATGLLIKGNESGGRVGSETTFVLLQRIAAQCSVPLWVQGGLSPRTLAACRVAGASGAILDNQLALAEECTLPARLRLAIKAMDGSETICLGETLGTAFRVHRMFGKRAIAKLQQLQGGGAESRAAFLNELSTALRATSEEEQLMPIGQDAAFAAALGASHQSVAGIVRAYRRQAADNVRLAAQANALREGSALAQALGTRYPIVQGPMTRVSDVPAFAKAVAQEGGLPFLALAMSREAAARQMLQSTAAALGNTPWGVGILAFVTGEIRTEQLRAVYEVKPRFAILAGGRPDQAKELDQAGITTYIHTPSPRLLEMFLKQGARRFVFEGRECGGHIGPLSSFVLWELVLDVMLRFQEESRAQQPIDVLFAGGIHDSLSAAMVSALAAQAAAANIRIGVLVGTAYLFTHEAVESGAIVAGFQEQALACQETIILDAEGGHAVRCTANAYQTQFESTKRQLQQAGHSSDAVRAHLEDLNIGRLRMASKGLTRVAHPDGGTQLVEVPPEQQQAEGMYMIGQVAALHAEVRTIEELHHDISAGAGEWLQHAVDASSARHWAGAFAGEPEPIAVVGIACLYPGASDLDTYWQNILRRHNAIREIPAHRWDIGRFYNPDRSAREHIYSKWGGFLDPIAFDPMHFGVPPTSLPAVEPLQLLMLEVVRRALRDSGYDRRPFPRERTGCIIGTGGMPPEMGAMFETRCLAAHYISQLTDLSVEVRESVIAALRKHMAPLTEDSFAGILPNVLAGRVANRFDFGGPNFTVDGACGSSLAALECAVKELRFGISDVVVTGGGDGAQGLFGYQLFNSVGALSPRGQCRPFDKSADGIAISDGVAAMVLKRQSDAVRDGDRIYCVIRHVAASSDGRDKSLTAPSVRGQRRALERAYAPLDFDLSQVGLIEAHGTGTVVGDRAELETLQAVFSENQVPNQNCALGSVKSLIGHAKNAAGIAGAIKCALALHHRVLPPTMFEEPNPKLLDRAQPFYLLSRPRPWFQSSNSLRRAGVSAFGFGGTNFHAVFEEYRADAAVPRARSAELLVFRAASGAQLADQLDALRSQLGGLRQAGLIDVAAAAQRAAMTAEGNCRLAIVSASLDELQQQLQLCSKQLRAGADLPASGAIAYAAQAANVGRVAYLFPGQGSQYVSMLEGLALSFPVVREHFEMAEDALGEILPTPLLGTIFPPTAYNEAEANEQRQRLAQTWYTQPALGAADYAMYALLAELGLRPDLVAGHSYGEYVALCVAGALSYQDLIRLSEARGRVVHETQGQGVVGMLAVSLSREELEPLISAFPGVSIAIVNAPRQCTVGGKSEVITAFAEHLQKSGVQQRRLPMSAGFHVPEAFAAAAVFARITAPVQFGAPSLPVYSGLTAEPYPADAGGIRRILLDQLTKTVRFKDQIEALYQAGARTFIEVGPGNVLSGLAQQTLGNRQTLVITTNRSNSNNALADLFAAVGRLYTCGVPLALEKLFVGCRLAASTLERLEPAPETLSPLAHWVDTQGVRPMNAPVRKPAVTATTVAPAVAAPQPVTQPAPAPAPVSVAAPAVAPVIPPAQQPAALAPSLQDFLREYTRREAEAQREREELLNRFLAAAGGATTAGGTTLPSAAGEAITARGPVAAEPARQATAAPVLRVVTPAAAPSAPVAAVASPPAASSKVAAASVQRAAAAPVPAESCEQILLEVVSLRTGYPRDLLQLDQDMEADLGIDSIKRTELFGALRDRLLTHQDAGNEESFFSAATRLRTLREVMQWLDKQMPREMSQLVTPPREPELVRAVATTVEPPGNGDHALSQREIAVLAATPVSEITSRESEREIASQVGNGAVIGVGNGSAANGLGGYTNGHASDHHVANGSGAHVATRVESHGSSEVDSHTALFEILSAHTGYPREMLQLDQNMEADLGIDSIKRTEIFGALRERLQIQQGAANAETFFSATARLRTLREVLQWLDSQARADQPQAGVSAAMPATAPPATVGARGDDHGTVYELHPPTLPAGNGAALNASNGHASNGHAANGHASNGHASNGHAANGHAANGNGHATHGNGHASDCGAKRFVVRPRAAELNVIRPLSLSFQREDSADAMRIAKFLTSRQWGTVLVTEDGGGRAAALGAALTASELPVRVALVRHGQRAQARQFGSYEADLLSAQSLQELRELVQKDLGPVSDLWHFLPLDAGNTQDSIEVRTLFMLAHTFGPDICAARGTLMAVTEMDGALGTAGSRHFLPGQAGIPGLVKSLAMEWPNATVRCWDTAPGSSAEVILVQAIQEFANSTTDDNPSIEAAYSSRDGRRILTAEEEAIVPGAVRSRLTADSVVLVTGGARGIAAHVARRLTAELGCSIIVTGRSPWPEPENPATAHLQDPTEIKRALTQQREVALTPKELRSQYERLMAAREMRATFASLQAAARHFEYHPLDVRDAAALTALVESIYQRHGRLDGVIHAAGVVDDTVVTSKSPAAFDAVYDTKVVPALTLARVLRPESLQFLVFFSSVAARFGCGGGADYAAANEVLNKLAWQLNQQWPARVVSIGWGPWSDVGLATRYSEKMHAERGFDWLPIDAGCQYFMDELLLGAKQDAEVVIYVPNGSGPVHAAQAAQRALAT